MAVTVDQLPAVEHRHRRPSGQEPAGGGRSRPLAHKPA
jgi:hypothetical protein